MGDIRMGDTTWNRLIGQLDAPMLIAIVGIAVLLYLFSRTAKKATAAREEDRQNWLQVGTNVATASGFLGTIVDIDGDAVTLQSPSGEETVWLKAAINRPMEIPLAPVSEDDAALEAESLDTKDIDAHDQDTTETDSTKGQGDQGQA